jgi:signal transduction histidine kinase
MESKSPRAVVLIVDDDVGVARLIEKSLLRENIRAYTVHSGSEALKFLSQKPCDLLLLDLKLPDIEGTEVLSQLRHDGKDVPFVIITGKVDPRSSVNLMKEGALDYVIKNMEFLDLVPDIVSRALSQIEKSRKLKELELEITRVSETERNSLGRELHDGICQHLAGIEFMSQVLTQELKGKPEAAKSEEISKLLRKVITLTRNIAHGLSPVSLQADGLISALQELAQTTSDVFKIKCVLKATPPLQITDHTISNNLYRIAQEAIGNAIKHGQAKVITINLTSKSDDLCLSITDDGKGIPSKLPVKGMGLSIMKHRANSIGATLEIQSNKGKGSTIKCKLPFSRSSPK